MFKHNVNQSYGSRVEEADLEFSLKSFSVKLPVAEPLTMALPQMIDQGLACKLFFHNRLQVGDNCALSMPS
ncbi:DNA polymerase zeta processivity subunit [Pyrus ussuriensis x Pyrus communis]|uniref:DNA polymerase zeta processivity subunit n=1 Tax=Pyrus ussuriensis x Pyrus communis TaxID=2448454 RepID=A0A5N5IAP5_9ROSA|nr:DNA polymerase zeta processivity subunit [Pyrus ussuriensis x Pyrus communis]